VARVSIHCVFGPLAATPWDGLSFVGEAVWREGMLSWLSSLPFRPYRLTSGLYLPDHRYSAPTADTLLHDFCLACLHALFSLLMCALPGSDQCLHSGSDGYFPCDFSACRDCCRSVGEW
jgi:hypothetical protein